MPRPLLRHAESEREVGLVGGDRASLMAPEYFVLNQLYLSAFDSRAAADRCTRPRDVIPTGYLVGVSTRSNDEKDAPEAAGDEMGYNYCFDVIVGALSTTHLAPHE